MSASISISASKLIRLLGTPKSPAIVDVRIDEDFAAIPELIPTAVRRSHRDVAQWAPQFRHQHVVVVCHKGLKLSQGVAAWLRQLGGSAETLEGGALSWRERDRLMVKASAIPARNAQGESVWVTRARPKVDRIACPWLIRRFVDPKAAFLFVAPAEVQGVATHFDATPFDVEGVALSHVDGQCTFDAMLSHFGLDNDVALQRLATIVRGADTDRHDLAPQAAGLLAASLGLSRMYADDLEQLEAGMGLYDAFYRWCRDAVDETHDWESHQPKAKSQGGR